MCDGFPTPAPPLGHDRCVMTIKPTTAEGRVLVGTQSFSYDAWDGLVYPLGLARTKRIGYYARLFPVVELDNTYYAVPNPTLLAGWAAQAPEGFLFSAKVPKAITQEAKLSGESVPYALAAFLDVMATLGERLGPIVFQMSPGFVYPRDFPALEQLLPRLPELGGEGMQFAIEFRHPSWVGAAPAEQLLRACGVTWIWNDWEPTEKYLQPMPRGIDEPAALPVTNERFAYVRLVGNHDAAIDQRTITIDRGADLERWADKVMAFRRRTNGDVYVLLNNHYAGFSAEAVRRLQRILGLPVVSFETPPAPEAAERAVGGVIQPRLL